MPSHYDISPITGLPQKRARKAVSDYLDWLSRGGGWQDVGVGDIFSPENRARLGDIAARSRGELEGPVQPLTRPLLGDPEEAGMQALDLVTPLAGITQMPREALHRFAEDIINRTRQQGGVTTNPRSFLDPTTGVSVGGRVPQTELQAPIGATTPEKLAEHLRRAQVNLDVEPWANVGGWLDEGKEFFDIPELFTGPHARHQAQTAAARRGELASWDIGRGEEIRTPPGSVFEGVHFAHQPLDVLDPARAGANPSIRGAERSRLQAPYNAPPSTFMGVAEGQGAVQPYKREQGLGRFVHRGTAPGVYDPSNAPEAVKQELADRVQARMQEMGVRDPSWAATFREQALREMGYQGAVQPRSGIMTLFQETPVEYLGELPPQLRGIEGRQLNLFGEGAPRLEELIQTPTRQRRFARQQQVEQDLFPVPELPAARAPQTRVRLPATPKRGTRTTVIRPQRKLYPGIYQGEEQILEQAARQWQPESPNLRDVFGLSRADVDFGYREMEERLGRSRGQPFAEVTRTASDYPRQVMGEANTRRLRNLLGLAAADPQFTGAYGWYWNEPLLQAYVQQLGPEEGMRQFRRFHQQGAALSPGSAVPKEIERASIYNLLQRQGRPGEFLSGQATPAGSGAGHVYHSSAHGKALERLLRTGTPFETDPLQAVKTKAYFGARTGENIWSPVMDAHFVRGVGLPDVRPKQDIGSIGEREAGRVADWYVRQVAQPMGMGGVGAQALQWNILGPQTGVESPLGAGLMEIMADLAARKAQVTGQTPREALDAFIRGEQNLFVPK